MNLDEHLEAARTALNAQEYSLLTKHLKDGMEIDSKNDNLLSLIDESITALGDILAEEPEHSEAQPTHCYLRWLRSKSEAIRFQLFTLAEASPENERAQTLVEDATPYFGYLPEQSFQNTAHFETEWMPPIIALSQKRYFLLDWVEEAEDIAMDLDPEMVSEVLLVLSSSQTLRVHLAAALVVACMNEDPWLNSKRREGLLDLAEEPTEAVLVTLAHIANEEDESTEEITALFRKLKQELPKDDPDSPLSALLWSMLRLPTLTKEERKAIQEEILLLAPMTAADAKALYETAELHEKNGDIPKAFETLEQILESHPSHINALKLRATLHLENGAPDRAVADFDKLIELKWRTAYVYASRGEAKRQLGEYEPAIQDLNEAVDRDPLTYLPCLWRGFAYQSLGQFDHAVADFNRVINLSPHESIGYYYRGSCRRRMNRLPEAIHDFSRCLEADPDDVIACRERAITYGLRGQREKAITDFTTVIELDPYAYVYNLRAMQHYHCQQYAEAIEDHAKACELDEEDSMGFNGLAWILATCPVDELRDGPRALEMAKRACELTEWENSGYVDTLAVAHAEIGEFDEAIRLTEKVIEMVGEDEKAEYLERIEQYRAGQPYRIS